MNIYIYKRQYDNMILSENAGTPKLQFEWADDGKTWNFGIP